jgi:hypothetical protein
MGVRSRRPERVRRRAMPVAMSIEWKPLRDSHYVIASLLPGGGGLRRIFATQSTLREVQALACGDPEQPVVGLLLGERLDCALTLTPHVLIQSHVEVALASLDERAVSESIQTLRGHVGRHKSVEVLGWFCSSPSANAAVSRTHAAVHAAGFPECWQTVLIFGDGGNAGAFFLYDSSAARWFHAPFHEVTDSKAGTRAPKPTCVAWPAYITTASVVPLAGSPQQLPLPPLRTFVAAPVSATARQRSVASSRPVVRARRTPARDAIVGAGRAAVAARRSALDLAKAVGGRALTASRDATESIVRIRARWAANAAKRKSEADAARAREDEKRAKEAAERRAAREEAQRRAAEVEKRRAAKAEARRAAEAEARRKAAEDAERRRAAETEARRHAAEAEARRRTEAAEAQRAAEAEAQRRAAEEAQRRAVEAEAGRKAAEEAQRKAAEEEQRRAAEAEAQRLSEEAEAEAQRKAAEAEEEARRQAAEAEALRISVQVAAIRARLARTPIDGSNRESSKTTAAQMSNVEETAASDEAHRYLAVARHEGFELSEKIERGSAEHPETVWLLHERQSGLRLIVVTTNEEVREASLHYNLRTEDDSLLRTTPLEHCDLESQTIYGREACLHDLRARCRRLRATGALQRDWKVTPTFQQPVSPR